MALIRRTCLVLLLSFCGTCGQLRADDLTAGFEAANRLYEQGRYADAVNAYERLLQAGPSSSTLYFNLGNAWFKAGQIGQAIAAYRQAEALAPRDPALRFNLQFARKKVSGTDPPASPLWQRALGALTLNEWAVLTAGALWLWFGLLALREVRPALKPALSGYTATAGVALVLVVGCLSGAAVLRFQTRTAVVIVPDAIARSGPLDEAKVKQQLRDGTEVTVLDTKEVPSGSGTQTWLQIRDTAGRDGWMKSDQLVVISAKARTAS